MIPPYGGGKVSLTQLRGCDNHHHHVVYCVVCIFFPPLLRRARESGLVVVK